MLHSSTCIKVEWCWTEAGFITYTESLSQYLPSFTGYVLSNSDIHYQELLNPEVPVLLYKVISCLWVLMRPLKSEYLSPDIFRGVKHAAVGQGITHARYTLPLLEQSNSTWQWRPPPLSRSFRSRQTSSLADTKSWFNIWRSYRIRMGLRLVV